MKQKRNAMINFALVLIMLVTSIFMYPQNIYAAENTAQIKKLVRKMDCYECTVLAGERKKIKLTKAEMAKAAALSLDVSDKNGLDRSEFGGFVTYKISNKKLQKASQNLFGLKLSTKNLQKKEDADGLFDAYRKSDGTPVVYIFDGESECDYVVHEINVKKKSSSVYQVEKKIYYGYWGMNNGQSNYKIVYQVNKSSKSIYGFKIKKIEVVPLN